jgi:hypothetical protein
VVRGQVEDMAMKFCPLTADFEDILDYIYADSLDKVGNAGQG